MPSGGAGNDGPARPVPIRRLIRIRHFRTPRSSVVEIVIENALQFFNELLRAHFMSVDKLHGSNLELHPFGQFGLFKVYDEDALAFAEGKVDFISHVAGDRRSSAHKNQQLRAPHEGLPDHFGPFESRFNSFIVPEPVPTLAEFLDNTENCRHVLV